MKSRFIMAFATLLLPVAAVLPYVAFGSDLRVLRWVWETNYLPFILISSFAVVMQLVCFFLISNLNRLGRVLFSLSSLFIILYSAVFAMIQHRHILLVVIFISAAVLAWVAEWIRKQLELPYFDSKRKWWESYPKSLPGLKAEVLFDHEGMEAQPVRIVNLGEEGCFVFLTNDHWGVQPAWIRIQLSEEKELYSKVKPMIYTKDKTGVGLSFLEQSSGDWHKEIQDHLGELRRIGYVST